MDGNSKDYTWGIHDTWDQSGDSCFETPCYYFSPFFENNRLEEVIETCETFDSSQATISNESKLDSNTRTSDVKWVQNTNETEWIYDWIWSSVTNTNGWNYSITGFVDLIQYTTYDSTKYKQPHYDWHKDNGVGHNHRKISLSILLNDDYEGGELELLQPNSQLIKLEKNEAVMFPSNTYHKVHPITKGTRKSLVVWVAGPKLK